MPTLAPAFDTGDANASYLRDQVDALVVQPVIEESVALQVSTVVRPSERVHKLRVPVVAADPAAAWVGELDEITHTEADVDEAVAEFCKVAGLTRISNEAVNDSDPSLLEINGAGLVRDIRRKIDSAFFSGTGGENAPAGLTSVDSTTIPSDDFANLDPFIEAQVAAEAVGARLTHWVMAPETWSEIATLKDQADSNRDLLDDRTIKGLPVMLSPEVQLSDVWGVPQDLVVAGLRQDATLVVDESRYLEYDAVAVRAVLRLGFAFPHEKAIVRITDGPSS